MFECTATFTRFRVDVLERRLDCALSTGNNRRLERRRGEREREGNDDDVCAGKYSSAAGRRTKRTVSQTGNSEYDAARTVHDAARRRYIRIPYTRRVLRMLRAVATVRRGPVVGVHAVVFAERVPAVGHQAHAVPLGHWAAAGHAVLAQRPHTPGQANGQGGRRVPAVPGGQLFRLLHRQRPAQLQPVLLVLSRAGNY